MTMTREEMIVRAREAAIIALDAEGHPLSRQIRQGQLDEECSEFKAALQVLLNLNGPAEDPRWIEIGERYHQAIANMPAPTGLRWGPVDVLLPHTIRGLKAVAADIAKLHQEGLSDA